MTNVDFIKRIRVAVYDSSVEAAISLLERPPGRKPSAAAVALSSWYQRLGDQEKEEVKKVIELSVRAAVFGMLTVLDGVTSLRDAGEESGSFELRFKQGTASQVLNSSSSEMLHDVFAAEVPPL